MKTLNKKELSSVIFGTRSFDDDVLKSKQNYKYNRFFDIEILCFIGSTLYLKIRDKIFKTETIAITNGVYEIIYKNIQIKKNIST